MTRRGPSRPFRDRSSEARFRPARDGGPPVDLKPGDDVRVGQVGFTYVDAAALRSFVLRAAG